MIQTFMVSTPVTDTLANDLPACQAALHQLLMVEWPEKAAEVGMIVPPGPFEVKLVENMHYGQRMQHIDEDGRVWEWTDRVKFLYIVKGRVDDGKPVPEEGIETP